jgi:glutaredoxin
MKLVLATSKTCGLCHMLKSKLKKDNIELETVEFEEDFEFFKKHQIKGVPKLLVFENSNVVEIIQGIDDIIKKAKNNN